MFAKNIALQETKRGVTARPQKPRVARPCQRIVEATEVSGGIHAEDLSAPRDIAHVVVRREIADGGSGPGGLANVSVVEHELVAPRRLVVEIVLPSSANDRPTIVA